MRFNSPTLGEVSLPRVIARIKSYTTESDLRHKIIIGTDSVRGDQGEADFVSAIVVHRVGNGGIYFWRREHRTKLHTLRDRIYQEALNSLELAQTVLKAGLIDFVSSGDLLEVHIDVGEHGPTREMIRELVGMVTGSGFCVRTKPDAYAASKVADRYT